MPEIERLIPEPKAQAKSGSAETDAPKRLSLPIGPDGKIQWESMRSDTQEKLRTALSGSPIASQPTDGKGVTAAETIDPALIGVLYRAIGSLAVTLTRSAGYSVEDAELARATDDELKELIPLTKKVLDKYASALSKYDDEIALALVLGLTVQTKVTALRDRPRRPPQTIDIAATVEPAVQP